ncbi:hypothetical protein T265_10060 [Opisthorchis viverrini]|uniref:Endonuclease/exonuclease/phosphatase domain-containing protein n=1 Tax=Opisthorchis viverrini TaxID=6198 RepID=A0A074ZEP0_OPIVI|nr:hypothetical protein T265_10060 [Opisthorchis viverrini]KER21670.1 hypothetical protein T265_10060 [Opisthorchis viverrini]
MAHLKGIIISKILSPHLGVGTCMATCSVEKVMHLHFTAKHRCLAVWAPWQYPSPRTTMTYTTNNTLMPHRPSRGAISRATLLAAYSRAGKRKHATADASLLSLSRFPSSALPRPNLNTLSAGPSSRTDRFARPASLSAAASARPSSVTTLNTSKSVFKPRKPVYLATFNVRTLKQAGQQVALARTLDSLCIDVCCLSETRTQDASTSTVTRYILLDSCIQTVKAETLVHPASTSLVLFQTDVIMIQSDNPPPPDPLQFSVIPIAMSKTREQHIKTKGPLAFEKLCHTAPEELKVFRGEADHMFGLYVVWPSSIPRIPAQHTVLKKLKMKTFMWLLLDIQQKTSTIIGSR